MEPAAEEVAEEAEEAAGPVAVMPGIAAASDIPPDGVGVEAEAVAPTWASDAVEAVHGLRLGAEGELVVRLQEVLHRQGYDPGVIDGRFDPETEAAVIDFQLDNDLEPSGVVDSLTDETLVPGGGLITLLSGVEEEVEEETGLVSATAENADDDDEGGVVRRPEDEVFDAVAPEERADDWRIFDAAVRTDLLAGLSAEALRSVGAEALVRSLSERGGTADRLKIGDDLAWHHRGDRSAALERFARQRSDEAAIDALPQTRWKTGNPAEDARISGVVAMRGEEWVAGQADTGAQWMDEAAATTHADASAALSILGGVTGGLW